MTLLGKRTKSLLLLVGGLFLTSSSALGFQGEANPSGFGVSKETVFWAAFWVMTIVLVLLFLFVAMGLLRSTSWNLGDAISEEAGNQPDPLPAGVRPILVPSSSRLIALLGLLTILAVFLGFGYYFLYSAFNGTLEQNDMRAVIYYLFSGAVVFAPYLANQLREAFTAFGTPRAGVPSSPVVLQSGSAVG